MAPLILRPDLPLIFPSSLEGFDKPASVFIKDHGLDRLAGIASGSVVFDTSDRILLLQRAAHDSQPGKWESPGGGVEASDQSVLYASARELWEEAGLVGTRIVRVVPVHERGANAALPGLTSSLFPDGDTDWEFQNVASYFANRSGSKIFCAFAFQFADVEPGTQVTLDSNEHQDFKWVTEEEMLNERMEDGFEIPIAGRNMKDMLKQAFKIRRESDKTQDRSWGKKKEAACVSKSLGHAYMISA
ncbi:hypothetical protein CFIMG_005837RAa [Ceratocystis fimbriata CBS 114723]|uniref:Nudix hydrolase domain-containing protein n=1 Tax=Ceratocystis fimbriata CBS 114723 TaxID=1035309 RepID=A0A2C5X077_9PEZI|nr:hypothetical protein CFIMG_005837RAa [Ceratocystis fimbriata CBS 114723]